MQRPDVPRNEAARLAALHEYGVLDTPAEPDFDGLTALLAAVLGVPIALISIVDSDRQWFKSSYGLAATETPRELSFCGHVVAMDRPLVVDDASKDERFHDNPFVTGDPHVRFYAGMPLRSEDGYVLGTLCALDDEPRALTESQKKLLETLARQVTVLLELRRHNAELERQREQQAALQTQLQASLQDKETLLGQVREAKEALELRVKERTLELARSEEDLAVTVDSLGDGVIATDREGRVVRMNRVAEQLTGVSAAEARGRALDEVFRISNDETGAALESPVARVLREQTIIGASQHTLLHGRAGDCPIAENAAPIRGADGEIRGVVLVFRDVRSERATRNALRESESKYRTLYDNLADMCATIDIESDRIVDCNQTFATRLGYTKDELVGHGLSKIYEQRSREAQAEDRAGYARSRELHDRERVLLRKDGSRLEASLSARLQESKTGRALSMAVWRDISSRKQAERDRAFVDGFVDLNRITDPNELMQQSAAAIANYLRLDRVSFFEIDGDRMQLSKHSDYHPGLPAFEGGHAFAARSELAHEQRAGRTSAVADIGSDPRTRQSDPNFRSLGLRALIAVPLIRDERWVASMVVSKVAPYEWREREVAVVQSIAERTFLRAEQLRLVAALQARALEEERRRGDERFRTLVAHVKDYAIFLLDAKGHVASWNAGAERIKGYAEQEILGQHLSVFYPTSDRERGHPQEVLERAAADGHYHEQGQRVRKDGSKFWADVTVTALYDDARKPIGFAKITRDISDQRHAEEVLRQRQVQLSASLKERDVLLQEVHHRVKNNLQVICSLLNLQMRKLRDQAALDALADCRARVQAIALIHETLYQVKDYASIPFDEYARGLAASIFDVAGVQRSKIDLHLDVEQLFLDVDRAIPCGLVLNELISNSLKHAFPDDRNGVVEVQLRTQDDSILLAVKDDGVGVSPEHGLARRTSLGLQLVKTLVSQLHGELTVRRDHGCEFQIRFPAMPIPKA